MIGTIPKHVVQAKQRFSSHISQANNSQESRGYQVNSRSGIDKNSRKMRGEGV